jgi:hypothetical protein
MKINACKIPDTKFGCRSAFIKVFLIVLISSMFFHENARMVALKGP